MEMAVEGLNQQEFSPKGNQFQEIVEDEEEDRISVLPDCLILEILSRLPSIKYAITTGTLSKRWKHLWTLVPSLIFQYDDHNLTWSELVSFVNKTLTQCRQLRLKKFELYTLCDIQCASQVNKWIHYAIRRNVEELNLMLWSIEDEFSLDQSFFINTCFTHMTLLGCVLNPAGAISWKNLSRLCIFFGKLDEDLVENILSGSPVLETLVLDSCDGYRHLDIKSKSIKNLVLNNCYGCGQLNGVEITAPNILSLTIKGDLWLRNLLLGNMSSLVEANLNYINLGYEEKDFKEVEEEILKGLILNLRHVKELEIGVKCSEVLARLEAKGFVLPSNMVLKVMSLIDR